MSNERIILPDDLSHITGYERPGDVERCLRTQGVRYFTGKDGPWTTIDLINAAGGLLSTELQKTGTNDIL